MSNLITKLYQNPKTILTLSDLAIMWKETNRDNLKAKTAYYVKQGALLRLTRGVFAKSKDYNPKELATSMYTPSYISFETVLREAGMLFQHHASLYVAGPHSITKTIHGNTFVFRKLKDLVLFNSDGVRNTETYSIATPERAFLDTIYLSPEFYFDNLRAIDWNICHALAPIYRNKQLIKRLFLYQEKYAG